MDYDAKESQPFHFRKSERVMELQFRQEGKRLPGHALDRRPVKRDSDVLTVKRQNYHNQARDEVLIHQTSSESGFCLFQVCDSCFPVKRSERIYRKILAVWFYFCNFVAE